MDSSDSPKRPPGPKRANRASGIPSRPDAVDWNEKTQVSMIREADPVEDLFDTLQKAQRPTGAIPKNAEEFAEDIASSKMSPWQSLQLWIRTRPVLFGLTVLLVLNGLAWGLYMWAKPDSTQLPTRPLVKDSLTDQTHQSTAGNDAKSELSESASGGFGAIPPRTPPAPSTYHRATPSTPENVAPAIPSERSETAGGPQRNQLGNSTTERNTAPPRPSRIREPENENLEYEPSIPRGNPGDLGGEDAGGNDDPDNPFGD